MGDDLLIFGGRDRATKYNDVWRLQMGTIDEDWVWTQLNVDGEKPPSCVRHTAVASGLNMICVGGDLGNSLYVLKIGGPAFCLSKFATSDLHFELNNS
jgi:hypothetical protein